MPDPASKEIIVLIRNPATGFNKEFRFNSAPGYLLGFDSEGYPVLTDAFGAEENRKADRDAGNLGTADVSAWQEVLEITSKVDMYTTISAGTGLSGGGNLSDNRTIELSAATIASLGKADTALQGILSHNICWVSPDGNPATAQRGRLDLPFPTIEAAVAAANSNDVINILPGEYTVDLEVIDKNLKFQGVVSASSFAGVRITGHIQVEMDGGLCGFSDLRFFNMFFEVRSVDGLYLNNCSSDGSSLFEIVGGDVELYGGVFRAIGNVFYLGGSHGSLQMFNTRIATDSNNAAHHAIMFEAGNNILVRLKDVSVHTAASLPISAPAPQTVYIEGSFNCTQPPHGNINLVYDKKYSPLVAFPAAANSSGRPGDIAQGTIGGVAYIAIYTGNGTTHSWVFTVASTTRPSDPA